MTTFGIILGVILLAICGFLIFSNVRKIVDIFKTRKQKKLQSSNDSKSVSQSSDE